ncbi:hypothetical protein [Streptomyces marispadix]|uniref:Integral membrane protein n=1 Tax=Streptomyces marispadix TaxID=2922868 RepID=A0ABS9T3Z5_9ACTN|nr:hypothetical protein [Streptomyces marispadix]MCH6163242.1 hypothetical protein [Streptomyces marispadix]
MSRGEDVTIGGLLVAEYEQIKSEQRSRIGFRDNLLYATLASMGAVIAAVVRRDGQTELLLLLPPVSVLLGWTYLVNDEKISAIGRYIREELAPRLLVLTDERGEGDERLQPFGWEVAHRGDARRAPRKYLQLGVDLLTFCVAPVAAVVVFWAAEPRSMALIAVSLAELAAVAVLAVQITVYADLRKAPRESPPVSSP